MEILCTQYSEAVSHLCYPTGTTKAFHLSQVGLVSVLSFQRHSQVQWLDNWFVPLASERAGPIGKWPEPHVILSKQRAHDLIWEAEPQDIFCVQISSDTDAITDGAEWGREDGEQRWWGAEEVLITEVMAG